jgi:hypothetical protein
MDEIKFSTTRTPEQKRNKIPITSLNYSKDSSTDMEHGVWNTVKTFQQQGPQCRYGTINQEV